MHVYIHRYTYIYIGNEVITFFCVQCLCLFPSFKNQSMDTKAAPKRPPIGHLGPPLAPLGPYLGHLGPCRGRLGPHWGHLPPQSMQYLFFHLSTTKVWTQRPRQKGLLLAILALVVAILGLIGGIYRHQACRLRALANPLAKNVRRRCLRLRVQFIYLYK